MRLKPTSLMLAALMMTPLPALTLMAVQIKTPATLTLMLTLRQTMTQRNQRRLSRKART